MSKQRGQSVHNIKRGQRYAMIPARVVRSDAYLSLSAAGLKLLSLACCELTSKEKNGDIALTRNQLSDYGFRSQSTLTRALKELLDRGLLVLTRQGGKGFGGKRPNLYALGWVDIPKNRKFDIDTPAKALNEWETYTAVPSKSGFKPKKTMHRYTDLSLSGGRTFLCPVDGSSSDSLSGRAVQALSGVPDAFLRSSQRVTSPNEFPEGHVSDSGGASE